MLHERIGGDDEVTRKPGAKEQRNRRRQMSARPQPFFAEEEKPQEGGFQNKRKNSLQRQSLADDFAGVIGEPGPVGAELKLQWNTGHHSHDEIETEDARPETSHLVVTFVAIPQGHDL